MFQSTLLKRTMSLVVLSLLASAILATIAFVAAGNRQTLSLEVDNAIKQDAEFQVIFNTHPEYLENDDLRHFFFDSSYATGHDYYLTNSSGQIINATKHENRTLDDNDSVRLVPILDKIDYEDYNNLGFAFDENSKSARC